MRRSIEDVSELTHLFSHQRDRRMCRYFLGHKTGKPFSIDGKRRTGRDARAVRGAHHQRSSPPHLLLQQTDGVVQLVASK